jgi:hypothetical protein
MKQKPRIPTERLTRVKAVVVKALVRNLESGGHNCDGLTREVLEGEAEWFLRRVRGGNREFQALLVSTAILDRHALRTS